MSDIKPENTAPVLPATVKPGWRTTEFYLSSAAVLLGILYASGIVATGGPIDKIAGLAATLLAALGYTVVRGKAKSAAAMLIVVMLAGVATQPACATVKAAPPAAGHAIVDCAKADLPGIFVLLAQLGAEAVQSALTTDAIDWPAIESSAWAHGEIVGGCAASQFVAALAAKQPAVQSLVAAPDPGREALARLSARWGGVEWR